VKTKEISAKTNRRKGFWHGNHGRTVSMRSLTDCTEDANFECDDSRDIVQKVIKMRKGGCKVSIHCNDLEIVKKTKVFYIFTKQYYVVINECDDAVRIRKTVWPRVGSDKVSGETSPEKNDMIYLKKVA